jgi:hypothetical protein
MKTLIVLSLIAAFASPAIANVVPSVESGKPACKKMAEDQKRSQELATVLAGKSQVVTSIKADE